MFRESETHLLRCQQRDWHRQARPTLLPHPVGLAGTSTWRSKTRDRRYCKLGGMKLRALRLNLVGEKRKGKWGKVESTGFNSLPYLEQVTNCSLQPFLLLSQIRLYSRKSMATTQKIQEINSQPADQKVCLKKHREETSAAEINSRLSFNSLIGSLGITHDLPSRPHAHLLSPGCLSPTSFGSFAAFSPRGHLCLSQIPRRFLEQSSCPERNS